LPAGGDRCGENSDVSARPQDYLRDEYLRRLETGKPVTFCLQAQFHEVKTEDDADKTKGKDKDKDGGDSRWYNPTRPWLDSAWIDVASLSFYSPLPAAAVETTPAGDEASGARRDSDDQRGDEVKISPGPSTSTDDEALPSSIAVVKTVCRRRWRARKTTPSVHQDTSKKTVRVSRS